MRNGKYASRNSKKVVVTLLALVLVLGCAIGGTIAWLTDTTGEVKNTFTVGDVDITLDESKLNDDGTLDTATRVMENSYKMIPGAVVNKDPKVTVEADSEACWVFIEVTTSDNVNTFLTYAIDTSVWTLVDGETNVYYKKVEAADAKAGIDLNIISNKQVTVNSTVTKSDMDTLTEATYPTLTFKAYAIQSANLTDASGSAVSDAAAAWALVNP